MKVNGVKIDDTYAEAFPVYAARVLITGATTALAETAATVATGFATSVIGCSAEAGIDRYVLPSETPDGRPGVIIMVVHPSKKQIKSNLIERIGECVLTAATTAVFNALESEETVPVKLHFFGDGYEYQTTVGGRDVWAIPILEGEFICEETYGVQKGVAGGNFFIYGDSQGSALLAAQAAIGAIKSVDGTITPFPGGIVASGSKVGCPTYSTFMKASTHHRLAPTLKDKDTRFVCPRRRKVDLRDSNMRPKRRGHRRSDEAGDACRGARTRNNRDLSRQLWGRAWTVQVQPS